MAKKGEKKSKKGEKKSKKGAGNLIVAILAPIIIIVMLAGAIISVIDAIVEIIVDVVVAIINFFRDPIGHITMAVGTFSNDMFRLLNLSAFNIDQYLNYRLEPTLTISNEKFEELVERLDMAINRDTMDITDISIKKMLLTYYRTIYLTSYTIRIELTEPEWRAIDLDNTLEEPFEHKVIEEDDENGNPTEKHYLQTTGCVRLINEDGEELFCYTREGLTLMYNEEYDPENDPEYSSEVQRVLENCYTLPADGSLGYIEMYEFTTSETTKTYSNLADGHIYSEEISTNGNATLAQIHYSTDISQYTVPVEFLMELLNITGSMEFIEEFMKLVVEETSIDLKLYKTSSKVIDEKETQSTYNTTVEGTVRSRIYSSCYKEWSRCFYICKCNGR